MIYYIETNVADTLTKGLDTHMEYLRIGKASPGDFSPCRTQANAESLVKIGCKMAENAIFAINEKNVSETTVIPPSLSIPLFGFGITICIKSKIQCKELKVDKTIICHISCI